MTDTKLILSYSTYYKIKEAQKLYAKYRALLEEIKGSFEKDLTPFVTNDTLALVAQGNWEIEELTESKKEIKDLQIP